MTRKLDGGDRLTERNGCALVFGIAWQTNYITEEPESIVEILAIAVKERNQIIIGNKVIEL